jgi:hypothetical protein
MEDCVEAGCVHSTFAIVPGGILSLSDDECVARLAEVIAQHDLGDLDEVAHLIGRLAVTIE